MSCMPIRLRQGVLSTGLAVTLAGLAACSNQDSDGAGVNVVLIDRSGSIASEDRDIYARSIEAVGADLDVGGRVLVAEIGDSDRSRFRTLLDVRVEDSDIRLQREANLRAVQVQLAEALPQLLPETPVPAARSTRILESLAAAAEAFGTDGQSGGRLFILSDGIEEGPVVNLARSEGGNEVIAAMLEQAREQGLVPDLEGVELYIIGAGGDGTPAGVEGIRAFWQAYAHATGATLVRIGRLPYEPL